MERQIVECDRCGTEIKVPYVELTIHSHHPRKIQLCGGVSSGCGGEFSRWLNPRSVPQVKELIPYES